MNFVEFHLGDYIRATVHLSMIEDAAYRRLLDSYYVRERPLPVDLDECCKLARAKSKREREAVAYVLREYFHLRDDGHHQHRADAEIERYQEKSRKAKQSAESRWKPCERNANAMRTHSEGNALHSPVTNPLSPTRNPTARPKRPRPEAPPEFAELKTLYPKRAGDQGWHKALRAANARIREGHSWTEILGGTRRYAAFVRSADKEGTEYVKQCATFLGPDKPFLEPWDFKQKPNAAADGDAKQAWDKLIASGGRDRDVRTDAALRKIGGWSVWQQRNDRDAPFIERKFIEAFLELAGLPLSPDPPASQPRTYRPSDNGISLTDCI